MFPASLREKAARLVIEGLSQKQVANDLGVSIRAVRLWVKQNYDLQKLETQRAKELAQSQRQCLPARIKIFNPILVETGRLPVNQPLFVYVTEDQHDQLVQDRQKPWQSDN